MHRLTLATSLLIAAAALSGCGGGSHPSVEQQIIEVSGVPDGPSAAGRIAYVSDEGTGMLWTVAADGSDSRLVARGQPNFPAWSPDGRRLAWECQFVNSSLCVAASDGRGMRRFEGTDATLSLLRPDWSPDGGSIEVDGGSIAADGTVAQLQQCDEGPCSPPGVRLVRNGNERVLEPSLCNVDWPRFSPDGRRLALVLECGMSESLETIARDGSDLRVLANRAPTNATLTEDSVTGEPPSPQGTGAGYFDHIDWSPDGRHVVFAAGGRRGWDIHVARWDGSHDLQLTHDHHSYYPSYSPDGHMIVYQTWSGDSWDIWTMRSDGTGKNAIITGAGNDTKPTWCCRG